MAEIIEKNELPVTITKVKIGTKDLTKKILDQIQWGDFIYCKHENGSVELGLPYIISDNDNELIFDKSKPYITDGTLIGYIKPTWNDLEKRENIRSKWGKFNSAGRPYFIVWYNNENNIKKGYIDQWTLDQLGLTLTQIFI